MGGEGVWMMAIVGTTVAGALVGSAACTVYERKQSNNQRGTLKMDHHWVKKIITTLCCNGWTVEVSGNDDRYESETHVFTDYHKMIEFIASIEGMK